MVRRWKRLVFYCALAVLVIFWLIPVTFCLFTAIKDNTDFFGRPVFELPKSIQWSNFVEAWFRMDHYILNDLIICIIKVPLGIAVEAMAAFAITRLNFRHRTKIFAFFLVGMMIPMQCIIIPLNVSFARLQLTNTYPGLILVYIGFGLSFGILVLRGFMLSIPQSIDESARIDGCNDWQLFTKITLPLIKPAIATLVILDFLSTWNEYFLSTIFITDDRLRSVPSGLASFFGEAGADYPLLCAAIIISIIPVLIVYLLFQRYFVEGTAGAVKG